MTPCPCCGAPLPSGKILVDLQRNTIVGPLGAIKVEPRTAELAAALVKATQTGRVLTVSNLVSAVWGAGDGPDDAVGAISAHIYRLRRGYSPRNSYPVRGIRSIGLDVERIRGRGYRLVEIGVAR